ncbi:MAG: metalloregulator ArsR/SmtB family transcription factor [bacterium]
MNREQLVRAFKALGNENRLKILDAIGKGQGASDDGPEKERTFDLKASAACCVDEIGCQFDMAQSTLSQNLKELHNAGLLERHKKAQWVYYTVNREMLEELTEYLRQVGCGLGS